MKAVLKERLDDVVGPMLFDGEQIDIATRAMVAVPSRAGSARLGLLLSVLTLGVLAAPSSPQTRFVVLTGRRLLVLAANRASGHPNGVVVLQHHRSMLRVARCVSARFLLVVPVLHVDLTVTGTSDPLRLRFASPARADGQAMVDALCGAAPDGG
jgi:hypothetical protein